MIHKAFYIHVTFFLAMLYAVSANAQPPILPGWCSIRKRKYSVNDYIDLLRLGLQYPGRIRS
jgi:hypothetical protein